MTIKNDGTLKRTLPAIVLSLQLVASALFLASTPSAAVAGFDEGAAALGRGDYAVAVEELTAAAKQGHVRAQQALGIMYKSGLGVPLDHAAARKWLRMAAEQGDAYAQYTLGFLDEYGFGIPQNFVTAAGWYSLAAEQGDADAKERLDAMRKNGLLRCKRMDCR